MRNAVRASKRPFSPRAEACARFTFGKSISFPVGVPVKTPARKEALLQDTLLTINAIAGGLRTTG